MKKKVADEYTVSLANLLAKIQLPDNVRTELELERFVCKAVRKFTSRALNLNSHSLKNVVYSHGDTPEERALWTKSKTLQNVVIYGCSNTSDIFITHPDIGTVYIELKLSKARRDLNSNSLPGDLQRSIGQSIIASLRHPYVICMVVCKGERKIRPHDLSQDLEEMLWKQHRIALVVRV